MPQLPLAPLVLAGALAGAIAGAAGLGCNAPAPQAAASTVAGPAPAEQIEARTTGLRVEWAVMDDRGRVETWFEDLVLLPETSEFPTRWLSELRDEDGRHPDAARRARFRRSRVLAVWPLDRSFAAPRAGDLTPELDTAFSGALPP